MIRADLDVTQEQIADFCRRHHIRWLAVFGSALRDDFGPESDIDVLVEFDPEQRLGLFEFVGVQEELSSLLGGRPVDMATVQGLNRWIKGPVLREARVIWSASERDGPGIGEGPAQSGDASRQATDIDLLVTPKHSSPQKEPLVESSDLLYLGHMLDSARKAHRLLSGVAKERFDQDEILQLALTRLIEVVGEAARRVSPAGRAQLPSVPWPQITGMRHHIVHDYLNVDLDEVWKTTREDLPQLIAELSKVVPAKPPE